MRIIIVVFALMATSCHVDRNDQYMKEIENTEKAFAEMVKKDGIPAAFEFYAADHAVLNRNNKLIKGKEAIISYFKNANYEGVDLDWKPDYIQVAKSGDIAYTYGKYTLTITDSLKNIKTSEGVFHTVWEKQADGAWKFVWD